MLKGGGVSASKAERKARALEKHNGREKKIGRKTGRQTGGRRKNEKKAALGQSKMLAESNKRTATALAGEKKKTYRKGKRQAICSEDSGTPDDQKKPWEARGEAICAS